MVVVVKEEERVISKGGNASLLYLPKEYFTPGEKVKTKLEVDLDGNLKMVVSKQLFNFTCDTIKGLLGKDATVEYDKVIAGTQVFSATKADITLNCSKLTRELEPTYVTISKRYSHIRSSKDYRKLCAYVKGLTMKSFDAYLEPQGELDSLMIYKDPEKYKLKDEFEAIDALNATGRKIGFDLTIRFNSKKDSEEQIRSALIEIKP